MNETICVRQLDMSRAKAMSQIQKVSRAECLVKDKCRAGPHLQGDLSSSSNSLVMQVGPPGLSIWLVT